MEALSAIPEQDDRVAYDQADMNGNASFSQPEPSAQDLNIFAPRPVKRFKLSHHELVPMPVPVPLHPQYLVSRQALDREGTPHMHFGDLETHELTIRNHDDTLLLVMADSTFDPNESILYYEIETKSEAFVVSMSIERRYVGLELIGGAARDAAAINKAVVTSQPYDPACDIRTDSRYPLALKSRFLQTPLNAYEWAVRLHELFSDIGSPTPSTLPTTNSWHRIGLLLDRSNNSLSATRDGQIVATTQISDDAAQLNRDIGLIPVFSLAKHGVARTIFGDSKLENNGFKFDLKSYIEQRQQQMAELVNSQIPEKIPMHFFSDFFQYYGYEKAARSCSQTGTPLRDSVSARAILREAIMTGHADVVPEVLHSLFGMQGSTELLKCIANHCAKEIALKHLITNTVPDAEEMQMINTREAAAVLIAPGNSQERLAVVKRCKDERMDLLDKVLDEVSEGLNETFNSIAFCDPKPVLRDLAKSFTSNIAGKSPHRNGNYSLLRGYLKHKYGDRFSESS